MNEAIKTIKDIFADYKAETNILNCKIKNINIFKKTNKIILEIYSDEKIELKELVGFEKYLKNRFAIEFVDTIINYNEKVEMPNLEEEWKIIAAYMANRHPITRPILSGSIAEIKDNNINVILSFKGSEMMNSRGFDKELEDLIKNLYGKSYKIKYIEKIDEEELKKNQEMALQAQKIAIKRVQQEAQAALDAQKEIENNKEDNKENVKSNNNISNEKKIEEKQEQPKEKTPVILGRNPNIKENIVNVADLTIDSGKVALDGEILNTDSRELKSGKFLVTFDLYDGTSTITCKAFVEADKVKDVLGRLKGAKGVKISGTAQFDPFAKELGVIANVIVETSGKRKSERMDFADEKRVELHLHTQMSQMDGMTSATDLIKRAVKWGMKSIAITDHGVVQAFPDAHKLLEKTKDDIKVIYGVEA